MFTGGTIGSKNKEDVINVQSSSYFLLDEYHQFTGNKDVQFEPIQPLNQLSENLHPQDWITFHHTLKQALKEEHCGVIITHGSDTLAHTTSAMSLLCAEFDIPIIFIASNYPIHDPRSNGLRNFRSAVDFIIHQHIPGCFVIYENERRESVVHLASRLLQCTHYTDEFKSSFDVPFGYMNNGDFHWNTNRLNPTINQVKKNQAALTPCFTTPQVSTDVFYIQPYPGIDYRFYMSEGHAPTKAILHDVYHSGTIGTRKEAPSVSLLEFIQHCKEQHIDFYFAPMRGWEQSMYQTTQACIEAGAIPLKNITVETALAKLMIAYGSLEAKEDIISYIQSQRFFEYPDV